jgi:D-aminoacyl-tRNA deacylase
MEPTSATAMKVLLQRVRHAHVSIDGATIAQIPHGLVALVGVAHDDTHTHADQLARKTSALRVFPGLDGGPERSVVDVGGAVLVVSQFTLMADTQRGNRPSWSGAAHPSVAELLVDAYAVALRRHVASVVCGRFGANMQVSLVNDGPMTLMLTT